MQAFELLSEKHRFSRHQYSTKSNLLGERQYVRFDCEREPLFFRTLTQPLAVLVLVLDQHFRISL